MNGVFVTGTDTGVGKTTVACALIRALRGRGLRVAPFKPVESGGDADARALREAAGSDVPIEKVAPYRFALSQAPRRAAEAEGVTVSLDRIAEAFAALRGDVAVAEGAGGLLVPLAPGVRVADAIARCGLPALVVARCRLGTLNHTLLTLAELSRRGIPCLGVVLNRFPDEDDAVRRWLQAEGATVLGVRSPADPMPGWLSDLAGTVAAQRGPSGPMPSGEG